MNILEYIKAIDEQWQTGNATEHSYRPALQQLLSEMLPQHTVTNEPSRRDCGAPDYIISQKKGAKQPVFFIEAKDLFDGDLDGMRQHKEQFNRYKSSLDYIVFTDYLDFHVYEHGEWVKNIRIGEQQGNHIRMIKGVEDDFTALIAHLADSKPTPIKSPSRLAKLMASKARLLADAIAKAFDNASDPSSEYYRENDQLQSELDAFKRVLIEDLTPAKFADIYAQTVAYGMFAARLHDDSPEDFSRQEAATLIPKTNPFLRQIFQTIAGYDLDDRIAWIVDDLAQTFLATDVERVMKVYGQNSLHKDTMIHFYEEFLSEYDPKLRKSMGVWYTPQPVVSFIVRAVDEVLKHDFNLSDGLADSTKVKKQVKNPFWDGKDPSKRLIESDQFHRVQILDPATGTGTFLAETVRHIYAHFEGIKGIWQNYVEEHLLKRLHGFELLMASYAVAHLKLDMLLRDTGYDSSKNHNNRLRVYLTNSLEESHPNTDSVFASWLANEAKEASFIKTECPVMVMMGNPPYSGISQNNGEWITRLIEDYKKEPGGIQKLQERKTWLNDDYVKFIRLSQDYVERNGQGVIGFINNNGFLDNPTFRGMRWNLLKTFDKIYIVNLHGNSMKKEVGPDGTKDENVFDIRVGVSINIFVKTGEKKKGEFAKVYYKDVYGKREMKFESLSKGSLDSIGFEVIIPTKPYYILCKIKQDGQEIYDCGVSIDSLFPINVTGLVTARDSLVIDSCRENLKKRILKFADLSYSDDQIRSLFFGNKKEGKYLAGDSRGWKLASARRIIHLHNHDDFIQNICYRPFDTRFIYYSKDMIDWGRESVNKNLFKPNLSLIVSRQAITDNWSHALVTSYICDNRTFYSNKGITQACPLYLYTIVDGTEERTPNLNKDEWAKFDKAVGRATTPEELLHYIYAVLHSPSYRERYKEFLKIDFPRIPLPESEAEFVRLGELGHQLIDLHLMHNADSWPLATQFPVGGDCKVDNLKAVSNKDDGYSVEVYINDTQYFSGVPTAAWNAYIGGYQPAQKWLKDRKGRNLSFEDIMHYCRIIYALAETQRIMTLI